jgi:competence protein ComFA
MTPSMKAELYGIKRGGAAWIWRATLGNEAVTNVGPVRNSDSIYIIRFRPDLSWGQASYLASRLNIACRTNRIHTKQIWREFISGCRDLGLRESIISRAHMQVNQLHNQASTSSRAPLNIRVLDQLIRILAGRSLLPEELMGLMESYGLGEWKKDWMLYVEEAVNQGSAELTTGLELKIDKSRLGKKRVTVKCRRCGTTGRNISQVLFNANAAAQNSDANQKTGIYWTPCRDCGGLCPYCEECLTMGRIRHCSVLIRGVGQRDQGLRSSSENSLEYSSSSTSYAEDNRWGLSPAQKAATAEGLAFLEKTALVTERCKGEDVKVEEVMEVNQRKWQRGILRGNLMDLLFRSPLDVNGGSHTGDKPSAGPPRFLIWAVTGAGKTEMIFPLMEYELAHGRRVLLTTPRRDVVLELKPRLEKAFPDRSVVALYGGSEDRWERGDITLATTHQLMRFYRAFDMVIIDELDAYPYHNNPMLEHAAEQVCSPGGRYIYLSATPPIHLQKEAAKGLLPHARVPVRYHRHPLPVPRRLAIPGLMQMVKRRKLPGSLLRALEVSLDRGAQIFVFVPRIALVGSLVTLLSAAFPRIAVDGTSSKDEARAEKVIGFRGKKIDLLVTTTILERGVTVPKTDVFILDSDASLFDEASLVQMAGRAGRSIDDPKGRVYFASSEWTASQLGAIRQIKDMNKLAREKGFLLD